MGCNQFVGTWKLISCEAERADGQVVYPFGANPIGMLMYDATGHMAAQLMRTDRPKFTSDDRPRATLEEKRAAFDGFVAYYGTYEVNEEDAIVTHHVEGSIFPNNIGSDQSRGYKFLDGKLMLFAIATRGRRAAADRVVDVGTHSVGYMNFQYEVKCMLVQVVSQFRNDSSSVHCAAAGVERCQ